MTESYSVKAILSAQDKNFSSIMKSCQGYANNLKTTLTGGLGFGAMAAIGGKAMSLVTNSVSDLSKETIETSDSMYKLQAAMRFSGYSEAEIQRIAGATGTLKTYADKTVFSLQDVMSTFGSLSANGIKDADKLTEAVGNAVKLARKAAAELVQIPELATIPDIGMNIRTSIDDLNDDYEYTRNETYTIYVPVEVDGRQVAKATAKYTKEEIEQQQKRDLRKKGMR